MRLALLLFTMGALAGRAHAQSADDECDCECAAADEGDGAADADEDEPEFGVPDLDAPPFAPPVKFSY